MSEGVFSHVAHICNAIVFIILCVDFFRCIFSVPFCNFAYNIMPLRAAASVVININHSCLVLHEV